MLKVLLPFISLLLLPSIMPIQFCWTTSIISLQLLTLLFIPLIPLSFFSILNNAIFLDIISIVLIILTLWITALMMLSSFKTLIYHTSPKKFYTLIMSLAVILVTAFSSYNLLFFYIMFEASLIPTLLLILGWGYQPERLQAGNYLMLYTITASLPLLLSILFLNYSLGHLSMFLPQWMCPIITPSSSYFWWTLTLAAFLVKTPMYLTHLWLPKAHVEAPVAGSMILAGILLKLGTYGMMRVSSLLPHLNLSIAPIISSISLTGATITSLICMRQTDIKSLIAYSSVSHMGLVTAGILSSSSWGWQGALTMMIAHGLCSSCMFALANMTYESVNSRGIFITKGLLMLFPHMTMWWFMFSACNMAAPPSINLMGEIFLITSIFAFSTLSFILLAFISFLAAAYNLFLYTSTQHGPCLNFSNPLYTTAPRNFSICLLHLTPIIMLISSPNFLSSVM